MVLLAAAETLVPDKTGRGRGGRERERLSLKRLF